MKIFLYYAFLLSAAAILLFSVKIIRVEGESMYPTLKNGDIVIAVKVFNNPNKNDIIVANLKGQGQIIKRLVHTPGEKIDPMYRVAGLKNFTDFQLPVRGGFVKKANPWFLFAALDEQRKVFETQKNYIVLHNLTETDSISNEHDYYFLVGDNIFGDSYDSRLFGPVKSEDIRYKMLFSFSFPF